MTVEITDNTGPRLALDPPGRYRTQANLARSSPSQTHPLLSSAAGTATKQRGKPCSRLRRAPLSPKARALIGMITTLAFIGFGSLLVYAGRYVSGGVLIAMGLFRGVVSVRQLQYAFGSDDD